MSSSHNLCSWEAGRAQTLLKIFYQNGSRRKAGEAKVELCASCVGLHLAFIASNLMPQMTYKLIHAQ